jgi:hypothetical protein
MGRNIEERERWGEREREREREKGHIPLSSFFNDPVNVQHQIIEQ